MPTEYEKGIKLEATPKQMVLIAVMFIVFFVAPAVIFSPKEDTSTSESYTQSALTSSQLNEGRVAGISTEAEVQTESDFFRLPGTNYQFNSDLSNPATLAIIVGGIFGLISISLFFSMFFDFFRG